jgi:hypothetical protein
MVKVVWRRTAAGEVPRGHPLIFMLSWRDAVEFDPGVFQRALTRPPFDIPVS